MKKVTSILLFMSIAVFSQAQKNIGEAFTKLNNLLVNAAGQQYNIKGTSTPCFLGEQAFSETVIESRTKINESEWVSRYNKIQWTELKDYFFEEVEGNENLQLCRLEFDKDVDWEFSKTGKKKAKIVPSPYIDFYYLSKDKAQVERLITLIGLHFF